MDEQATKQDSTMRGDTTRCNAMRCDANDRQTDSRTSVDVDQGRGGRRRAARGVSRGVVGRWR